MSLRRICVFCGSRVGDQPAYLAAAGAFGAGLATAGLGLVYGGGRVGLMGAVAQAALDAGGYVTGVIPGFLKRREVVHTGLQSVHTVNDLFERKAMMLEIADAFVALPGGLGTFDELLEVIAWRQLRQLDKPIALLDTAHYFAPLLGALRAAVDGGFTDRDDIAPLIIETEPAPLIARLVSALPPAPGLR